MARDANGDRVGISYRAALRMFYDAGFNDPIGLENAALAIREMESPTAGYVYADDVPGAIRQLQEAAA